MVCSRDSSVFPPLLSSLFFMRFNYEYRKNVEHRCKALIEV